MLDFAGGAIGFVGDDRGESSLEPFWFRLSHSRAKIAAVATDLSPVHSAEIRKKLPQARLVFAHFPLVKLLNRHLTELRRARPPPHSHSHSRLEGDATAPLEALG